MGKRRLRDISGGCDLLALVGRVRTGAGWAKGYLHMGGGGSWEALVGFCIFILSAWMRFASCFRRACWDALVRRGSRGVTLDRERAGASAR